MNRLTTEWQVGDGREEALAEHVTSKAVPGDLDSAIKDLVLESEYLGPSPS